jgi:hypothetical protein
MDWRELWRLTRFDRSGTPLSAEGQRTAGMPELVDTADAGPNEHEAARTRFFYVAARTLWICS